MTSNSKNEIGRVIDSCLIDAGHTQSSLARAAGCDRPYLNKVIKGAVTPSPQWVELIANSLGATPQQRGVMHRAAARDHGFKIDLT